MKQPLAYQQSPLARVILATSFLDYPKASRLIKEYDKAAERVLKQTIEEKRLRKLMSILSPNGPILCGNPPLTEDCNMCSL